MALLLLQQLIKDEKQPSFLQGKRRVKDKQIDRNQFFIFSLPFDFGFISVLNGPRLNNCYADHLVDDPIILF